MLDNELLESIADKDPEAAFVVLAEDCEKRLEREATDANGQTEYRAAYRTFYHDIMGMSEALELPLFDSWVPPDESRKFDEFYEQFVYAVRQYVTQQKVKLARGNHRYSVALDTATKERIRNLVGKIKEHLDQADLEDRKRNRLNDKLNAFLSDVDRTRTPFQNGMLAFMDVASTLGKSAKALQPVTDFITQINILMGNAKADEPEVARLPAPPKRIEGPKTSADSDFQDIK